MIFCDILLKKGGIMKAVEYFLSGYSCSESIVREAVDEGLCDESLFPVSSAFSGGIGTGCLCGAVSGAIMVIGNLFGKNNKYNNEPIARKLSKEFIEKFKSIHKCTCCKILSKDFEMNTSERKKQCCNFVEFCSDILRDIVKVKNDQYKL